MSTYPIEQSTPDYSESFYKVHAERYADVAEQFLQSVYIKSSHTALRTDSDLLNRLQALARGRRGLDAGCGSGARDVFWLWQNNYDIYGIDAVEENIMQAKTRHPEIANRVSVADLRNPLQFSDEHFDFVSCNSVIQHIDPNIVFDVTLSEFARVLKPNGVLQLMFKNGRGVKKVYDRDYKAHRSFHLYDEREIFKALADYGLELIEAENADVLGGIMYFTDPKPMEHCVVFLRKLGSN